MKNPGIAALLLSLAALTPAFSATTAIDNASASDYSDGWQSGDNGGSGFGEWALNAGGGGGAYIGGTGQGASPSFGLFASSSDVGAFSTATRGFTGGALSAGQTFSIDLGNTGVDLGAPGQVGINLQDGGVTVFELKFIGGNTNWLLNDGGSDFSAGQGFAANTSLTFSFTYEGGSTYSYSFGSGSGSNFVASSTISGIDGFELYSSRQGGSENFGANNISIVPEPSITLLGSLGILGLLRRRRS